MVLAVLDQEDKRTHILPTESMTSVQPTEKTPLVNGAVATESTPLVGAKSTVSNNPCEFVVGSCVVM